MLRKAFIINLIVVLMITLGACGKGDNGFNSTEDIENKAPTAVTIIEKKDNKNIEQITATKKEANYSVTGLEHSLSDNDLKYEIKYPQISGLSDNDRQKKINNILKDEAIKVLKYYEEPYGSVELSIDYKVVMKNPNVLSIQYTGLGSVSNAAHPNSLFFTTNINIKTGDRLRLKDIMGIDTNFTNKFLNGSFKALRPEHNEVLRNFTIKEIEENFNEADSLDNIGTEKQSDVFSYFTSDAFGISISVGRALGDHAEFEINYKEIEDNIINEKYIWKDLMN